MSNLARQFPSGAPFNGELPSSWVEYVDAALPKLPNAIDGSSHVGTIVLGGVQAQHITKKRVELSPVGNVTVTLDCDVYNLFVIRSQAGSQILTLSLVNYRDGDQITIIVHKMQPVTATLTLAWLPGGAVHRFPESTYDDQVDHDTGAGKRTTWKGEVISFDAALQIHWSPPEREV